MSKRAARKPKAAAAAAEEEAPDSGSDLDMKDLASDVEADDSGSDVQDSGSDAEADSRSAKKKAPAKGKGKGKAPAKPKAAAAAKGKGKGKGKAAAAAAAPKRGGRRAKADAEDADADADGDAAMDAAPAAGAEAKAAGAVDEKGAAAGAAVPDAPAPLESLKVAAPAAVAVSRVPKGQRLIIKGITVHNFKSYSERASIGPFHNNFTSIVGPNGSGKSNVIDALLFVFGKKAAQIRLKKMTELIHKSAAHPNLKLCEVTVHFQRVVMQPGGGAPVPVEGSDFSVTRRVERSADGNDDKATSKYYINHKDFEGKGGKPGDRGKGAQFKDVAEELGGYGIDLVNNRFLILQGEVEAIAMMPPKAKTASDTGLLEYLEEIIGSSRFAEAIDEQGKVVENRTEARGVCVERVKAVEKEKDALEGPRNEAVEFHRKTTEKVQYQAQLTQHNVFVAEQECAQVQERYNALNAQFEGVHAKHQTQIKEQDKKEAEYNAKKEEFDITQSEMTKARAAHDAADRKLITNKETIKHTAEKAKKANERLKKDTAAVSEMKDASAEAKEEIPKLHATAEKLTKQKEKAEAEVEATAATLREKTQHIAAEKAAVQKQLIPKKQVVNKAAQAVADRQKQIDRMDEELQAAEAACAENKKQTVAAQKLVKEKTAELKAAEGEYAQVVAAAAKLKAQNTQAAASEQQLASERAALFGRREEARVANAGARNAGAIESGLGKEKNAGRLPGYVGRLGALGTIDDRYDVAISTACPALKTHYVTVDMETANAAVAYLKAKELGVATFIALSKLDASMAARMKPIRTPEDLPRLFDLVKPKSAELAPAFYQWLNDTLVADSLEQANRVSESGGRRWRVVTIDGKLIETTGTMSGGGAPMRGGMSSKLAADHVVDEKEVAAVERQFAECEKALSAARATREQSGAALADATKREGKLEHAIKKLGLELKSANNAVSALHARLQPLEAAYAAAASKDEQKRKAELARELKEAEGELAKAKKATESLEAKIDELDAKLMAAGGAKLKTLQATVTRLDGEIDAANTAANKAQVLIETNAKKLKKTLAAIDATKTEIADCADRKAELEAEQSDIMSSAADMKAAFTKANERQKEKYDELTVIQKAYDAIKKEIAKIKELEVDITNQMEGEDRALKTAQKVVKTGKKQFDELVKRIEEAAAFLDADDDEQQPAAPAAADAKVEVDEKGEPIKPAAAAGEAKKKLSGATYTPLTDAELEEFDKKAVVKAITYLEDALKAMKPNMRAIDEYQRKAKEYAARVEALDKVTAERDTARKHYDSLRKQRLDEFMGGFSVISMKLKEMYQMLTLGGDAELELVDSLDPFSEGIAFSVRPPKKSWKQIQNLSGGEKTLSSLALVFALHHYKPTPLYVMDEIDAALDFKNVSIVANYIKERTQNAQFVIISLRNNMFELADRLVGIYKTQNQTKSITIDPRKFALPAAAMPPPHPLDEKKPLNANANANANTAANAKPVAPLGTAAQNAANARPSDAAAVYAAAMPKAPAVASAAAAAGVKPAAR